MAKKKRRKKMNYTGTATGLKWKQRKAIQLLVGGCDEKQVAEELSIHPKTLKRWMHDKQFAEYLEDRLKELESIDAKYRAKLNKYITKTVYGEIVRRLSEGKTLKKLSFTKLLSAARLFNHEIRVDTPGDVTSRTRVEHSTLEDIGKRFKEKDKEKVKKTGLSLVEPPKEDKEASNG